MSLGNLFFRKSVRHAWIGTLVVILIILGSGAAAVVGCIRNGGLPW